MKRTLSNCRPDKLLTPYEIQPISKGGTGSTNLNEVITNFDLIPKTQINQPNGILGKTAGKIDVAKINKTSSVTIDGPSLIAINTPTIYTISNYDSSKTYTVSVSNGTATVNENKITVIVTSATSFTLTVNTKIYPITSVDTIINKPSITFPTNNVINMGESVVIITSPYTAYGDHGGHNSTDWQVSRNSNFTDIVINNQGDTERKTSFTILNLTNNTEYYLRARYKTNNGTYSEWSNTVKFKTRENFIPTTEKGILSIVDSTTPDEFGVAVAINGDGTVLAVGAWNTNAGKGSVYIYRLSRARSPIWVLETIINNPSTLPSRFGVNVSISESGDVVGIGAYAHDNNKGAAYICERIDGVWQSPISITPELAINSYYGVCIDLSSDGRTAIVTSYFENNRVGAAYVYEKNTQTNQYELLNRLSDPNGVLNDQFGIYASISGDKSTISIGAWNKGEIGAVFIFKRIDNQYSLSQTIQPSDIFTGTQYGVRSSLNYTADTLIVGAWKDLGHGSVYIYKLENGEYAQRGKIIPSDPTYDEQFGTTVHISRNGNTLVTGAWWDDEKKGSAYLYNYNGSKWVQVAKITPLVRTLNDQFGRSVALDNDAKTMIISSAGVNSNKGAVYVYR